MKVKYPPLCARVPHMLHGADYNPDQWFQHPEVLQEDIRMMKLAKCNVMSVGIFSWSSLEPEEGRFEFDWMDRVLGQLSENGIFVLLATPSGARPAWMSARYPEILRVEPNRIRILHGGRHNHCFTSPVYRSKVKEINRKLAQRYAYHPAVIGWHVSNEYSGDCHCPQCQDAFRSWLQQKYGTLERLNECWYTSFWSHTFTDWRQIESPAPHGEKKLHGLNLDWKRFVTDQTADFLVEEIKPLKEANPDLLATTNFMGTYEPLNYWKLAKHVDVISWDSYPSWHAREDDISQAIGVSMVHDLNRSFKGGQPFLLIESTPSTTNWQPVSKLKKPGMHLLASAQAIAHGSDSVQYFQWRKSRGASEKFHGAVVDHCGHEHTRVFRDVTDVGNLLEGLDEVVGTTAKAEVAIVFDWENRWALKDAQGPRNAGMHYEASVKDYYSAFWKQGITVDILEMDCSLDSYKLIIAPMLYMLKPGVAERIEQFVNQGGVFVTTYWSGIVDEYDLCFLDGFPGPLRKVLGIWSEEIDALYDHERNGMVMTPGNGLGLEGTYESKVLCDLVHLETAQAIATYTGDFYAGRPAITENAFGNGRAYYVATSSDHHFYDRFCKQLVDQVGIDRNLDAELPHGVTVQRRTDGEQDYLFLLNFTKETLRLASKELPEDIELAPYGVSIVKCPSI